MTERLAVWSSRRPWLTLASWAVVLMAAIAITAAFVGDALSGDEEITSDTGSKRAVETYRFICFLDRIPPHILEDPAFRMLPASGEVEVELEAEDFAGAVAEAIRTLEVDFVHVLGVERLI